MKGFALVVAIALSSVLLIEGSEEHKGHGHHEHTGPHHDDSHSHEDSKEHARHRRFAFAYDDDRRGLGSGSLNHGGHRGSDLGHGSSGLGSGSLHHGSGLGHSSGLGSGSLHHGSGLGHGNSGLGSSSLHHGSGLGHGSSGLGSGSLHHGSGLGHGSSGLGSSSLHHGSGLGHGSSGLGSSSLHHGSGLGHGNSGLGSGSLHHGSGLGHSQHGLGSGSLNSGFNSGHGHQRRPSNVHYRGTNSMDHIRNSANRDSVDLMSASREGVKTGEDALGGDSVMLFDKIFGLQCLYSNINDKNIRHRDLKCNDKLCEILEINPDPIYACPSGIQCTISHFAGVSAEEKKYDILCLKEKSVISAPLRCGDGQKADKSGKCRDAF